MNLDSYDKLILQHQEEVNKQGYIMLINVGEDLFETQVNFAKHPPNSVSISIRKFHHGRKKV